MRWSVPKTVFYAHEEEADFASGSRLINWFRPFPRFLIIRVTALDRVPFSDPTEWAPPQFYSQSNLHQQAYTKLDWLNGSSAAGVPMGTVSRQFLTSP